MAAYTIPFGWVGIGCDSVSSVPLPLHSRYRVKSRASAVIFNIPLDPPMGEKRCPCRDCCVRACCWRCGQFPCCAETVGVPLVPRYSLRTLLRCAVFRGVIGAFRQTAPASLTASGLRCLGRSRPLCFHSVAHLAPAAGLLRSKLVDRVLPFVILDLRRMDRYPFDSPSVLPPPAAAYGLAGSRLCTLVSCPLSRPLPTEHSRRAFLC